MFVLYCRLEDLQQHRKNKQAKISILRPKLSLKLLLYVDRSMTSELPNLKVLEFRKLIWKMYTSYKTCVNIYINNIHKICVKSTLSFVYFPVFLALQSDCRVHMHI